MNRVKIDRRGILTVKSILDERANTHYIEYPRDRRYVNQGRFNDFDRRRTSSNTFNSELNTFRSKTICCIIVFVLDHVLK